MSAQDAHDSGLPQERSHTTARALALGATLLALVALLLAACGAQASAASHNPPATPAIGHVTITAQDYAFQMPSAVPAGPVEFTFVNHGTEVRQAQFFHLKPGFTSDQFIASLKAGGPASIRSLAAPWGGVDETSPHKPAVHVIDVMAPGTYVVASLVVDPVSHKTHAAMGMYTPYTVTFTEA